MRVAVHLHGPYRAFHEGPVFVEATTAAEAIEMVTMQLPGFRPDLKGRKQVQAAGLENLEDYYAPLTSDELHLVPPVTLAGGDNGLIQTVVGAVLIVVGVLYPPLAAYLIPAGIGMMAGGILMMLAPQPALSQDEEEERSRYLGSPGNTVGIGTRIAIGYGYNLWAGHYYSLNINAADTGI